MNNEPGTKQAKQNKPENTLQERLAPSVSIVYDQSSWQTKPNPLSNAWM
jgi:hypothetical protein